MHYTSYSDRLASSFRSALDLQICSSGRNFHFPRGSISQQLLLPWTYAVSAKTKTTLQIIRSIFRRSSCRVCVRCYRVNFHLFTSLCLCGMFFVSHFLVRAASERRLLVLNAERLSSGAVHGVYITGARERRQAVQFAARSSVSRRPHNRHA